MRNKIISLEESLKKFYFEKSKDLPFHGWHHINFVRKKSVVFAKELGADVFFTEAAALTHDLNYAVKKNSFADDGRESRVKFLEEAGFSKDEIKRINIIITEAEISARDENISAEAKALSDGDTLFKALPMTPMFASKYLTENDVRIEKLANKIVAEQTPLMHKGIYFYSNLAKEKYLRWAKANLELWVCMKESLEDEDVVEMLKITTDLEVL